MFRRYGSSQLSFGGRTLHEEESGLRTLVFSRLCALGTGAQLPVPSKNSRASCKINTYKFESLNEINKQNVDDDKTQRNDTFARPWAARQGLRNRHFYVVIK